MKYRMFYYFISTLTVLINTSSKANAAATFLPDYNDKLSNFSSSGIDFSNSENGNFNNCIIKNFNKTSCKNDEVPADFCPDNNLYFKTCLTSAQICKNDGFALSCNPGYIKDSKSPCPENSDYGKCIANPCTGFDYTLSEATSPGYIVGAKCLSGENEKYQRSEADCPGFAFDTTNCNTASKCEKLGGSTCQSGTKTKYAQCTPCPVPTCPTGKINYNSYWCQDALKCWWPG